MTDKPKTREIAIEIIANTFCEGPSGNVGGTLAEDIMKNLEAGGFNFTQAKLPKASEKDDVDPPHADPTHKHRFK